MTETGGTPRRIHSTAGAALAYPGRPCGDPSGSSWLLATWIALAYLVLSTLVLFVGFLFVAQRWAAPATSYATVLFPLVTVAVGAVLASEQCRSPSSRAPPS